MHKILVTADGSHTLFVDGLDEQYHSIHGAIAEAKHVFIQSGFDHVLNNQPISSLNILEVGFGTGLNALITYLYGKQTGAKVNYTSIEPYPLDESIVSRLNYPILLECDEDETKVFKKFHTCKWNEPHAVGENFSLFKKKGMFQELELKAGFDLVYFDAFGPRAQSELWEESIFAQLFNCLRQNGCLVTYCAKGQVRRNMQKVGFEVERLPGPPGKREMLRATKLKP